MITHWVKFKDTETKPIENRVHFQKILAYLLQQNSPGVQRSRLSTEKDF